MNESQSLLLAPANDRLGIWSVYFGVKIALFFAGSISLDLAWNIAFLILILATASGPWMSHAQSRIARDILLGACALALLWRDSWLPPFADAVHYARQGGIPSGAYAARILGGLFWSPATLAAVLLALSLNWARRRIHMTWPIIAALYCAGIGRSYSYGRAGAEGTLAAFFSHEATRRVDWRAAGTAAKRPDIFILQVCSLSNDDLAFAHLGRHPFWNHFDLLLTRFNTATSHSGPSALRLFRASCGQSRHDRLFDEFPEECSLWKQLQRIGYRTSVANDHDGAFEGFSSSLEKFAHAEAPLPLSGLPSKRLNYEGTPIKGDYDVLKAWWRRRIAAGPAPAALYSNLISLHGGSRRVDDPGWWRKSKVRAYGEAFETLASDIERFEAEVEASGKTAVLIFVPEHGAALRGSSLQVEDLREMPLPQLTMVPVGIKLLGVGSSSAKRRPVRAEQPLSYLGLAQVIASLTRSPEILRDSSALGRLADALPETPLVAENQSAIVFSDHGRFLLKTQAHGSMPVPEDALPRGGIAP